MGQIKNDAAGQDVGVHVSAPAPISILKPYINASHMKYAVRRYLQVIPGISLFIACGLLGRGWWGGGVINRIAAVVEDPICLTDEAESGGFGDSHGCAVVGLDFCGATRISWR